MRHELIVPDHRVRGAVTVDLDQHVLACDGPLILQLNADGVLVSVRYLLDLNGQLRNVRGIREGHTFIRYLITVVGRIVVA